LSLQDKSGHQIAIKTARKRQKQAKQLKVAGGGCNLICKHVFGPSRQGMGFKAARRANLTN
jgi:fructose 1,6-bisphosphatase